MSDLAHRVELTAPQKRVLDFVRGFIVGKGYPPSVREIGDGVGMASSSTVHGHLARLEEKGYIRRDPTKSRTIELIGEGPAKSSVWQIPVVGRVAAGPLTTVDQDIEEYVPVAANFVRADPDELFFLTVRGESMVTAGILSGDLVLVRRQAHAANGEIIVALVEEEATVKRFYKEKARFRLQPENPYMDPIYVDDLSIVGKVVAVIRRTD